MAKILICSFISQQCSVLASFSLMVLFIVRAKTRLWPDELRHCHHVVLGPADMCTIKGDDFISLPRDVLVASASMMPEPATESHGYSNPLDQWALCRFLSGKRISDYC
jgi:hypothetical protein